MDSINKLEKKMDLKKRRVSDSWANLFRIMKASPSEAVLIPLTSIVQTARPATDTVAVSCSDSSAVGREIAWHRGGATQEGDSGFGPSCRQDETLVPFSLMTNPAGLGLIISAHKQHTPSLAHKYTHRWA